MHNQKWLAVISKLDYICANLTKESTGRRITYITSSRLCTLDMLEPLQQTDINKLLNIDKEDQNILVHDLQQPLSKSIFAKLFPCCFQTKTQTQKQQLMYINDIQIAGKEEEEQDLIPISLL